MGKLRHRRLKTLKETKSTCRLCCGKNNNFNRGEVQGKKYQFYFIEIFKIQIYIKHPTPFDHWCVEKIVSFKIQKNVINRGACKLFVFGIFIRIGSVCLNF